MLNVPMLEPQKSVDRLEYNYIISDGSLVGDVRRTFTGDAKRMVHEESWLVETGSSH